MPDLLPIGVEELLGGAVENARLECKASWDPATTGPQVLETLCAFVPAMAPHQIDGRLAEARGTGVPKIYRTMRENGSPEPRFDFDAPRSFFRVTLPAHA